MARGDLILYRSSGKWYERAIVLATSGPYVHVGVMTGDRQVIAARLNGIELSFLSVEDSSRCTIVSIAPKYATYGGVEAGLTWASQQLGKKYGWVDIFDQMVKFIAPNNPFQLVQSDHWDCSDFCTRYLQHAGMQLLDMYSDPYQNTPNDIGRIFGLVKPRKG